MQIQETPQLQYLFNITMELKQLYSFAIQESNNHQFFALHCSPFMYILDKQGQILHFIQSYWMSSCFSNDSKYISISCFQDETRFIILYDLVENKKKWVKEISNLHIKVQLHFYFQSIIIASNHKVEMYTVDGSLEKFKGIYCKFDSNNIKINNQILLSCGSRLQDKYLFFSLKVYASFINFIVEIQESIRKFNHILRNVSLGKIQRKFQCTNNFNKQVIIKHIFINIQGNQLFQNHYLVYNNVEHFQIFYSALMKFFNVYITWYPIVESPLKLDDQLLNPLWLIYLINYFFFNQDYIKIVSEYEEKIDKLLIEKTIKSHSILSEILRDGMTIMSAKRLNDLANSYQIVYQEYYNLIKQYNSQDEMLLYLTYMEFPKFYFFVSKLFKQKNKNEEFRMFVLLGLEQAKQETKFILNNIQNYDQDHQARVFGQLIEYPNQLQKFYGIISGTEEWEFLINYLQYQKEIIERIGYFQVDQNILMYQSSQQNFQQIQKNMSKHFRFKKFVYGQRHRIQVDTASANIVNIMYRTQKINNLIKMKQLEKQLGYKIQITSYNFFSMISINFMIKRQRDIMIQYKNNQIELQQYFTNIANQQHKMKKQNFNHKRNFLYFSTS